MASRRKTPAPPTPLPQAGEGLRLAEIPLDEGHPRQRVHRQDVQRQNPSLDTHQADGDLAPAAGRGPQVGDPQARPQKPVLLLDL